MKNTYRRDFKVGNKYFVFSVLCSICLVFFIHSANLSAEPQGHEHTVKSYTGKPESEGARIVSGFKFKPLNFVPPKVTGLYWEMG